MDEKREESIPNGGSGQDLFIGAIFDILTLLAKISIISELSEDSCGRLHCGHPDSGSAIHFGPYHQRWQSRKDPEVNPHVKRSAGLLSVETYRNEIS